MSLPIKVIVGGKTNCCSSALSLKVAKEQTKNIYLLYFKLKLFALHFPFKAFFFFFKYRCISLPIFAFLVCIALNVGQ